MNNTENLLVGYEDALTGETAENAPAILHIAEYLNGFGEGIALCNSI